ncbi:hypothetical protein ERHA55_53220 (plasmid) [Erwinia rhapontici]|nr:hypothetical protein ERHA55_53220 [Erwinia rhapontici]
MELNKLTVVQGNDLLEGAYSVTLDEMRLLNLALAQIDSRKPQPMRCTAFFLMIINVSTALTQPAAIASCGKRPRA